MKRHVRQGILGLSILTLAGLGACTTPQSRPLSKAAEPSPKLATRSQTTQTIAKPGTKEANTAKQYQESLEQRFIRTVNPSYQVTEQDLALVQSLDSQSQPMEEAIALLIVLRFVGTQNSPSEPGFVTKDLNQDGPDDSPPPARLLQEEARKLGFHFSVWNTLAQNPFLQLPIVYRQVEQAIQRLGNAPKDRELLTKLLKHRASSWAGLLPSEEEAEQDSQQAESNVEQPVSPMQIEPPKVGRYSLADLNRGDALLRQAQRFAERGDYKQAIQYASRIARKDPLYPAASEKIKAFSNQAVQDLRQKAAQAFQSALPVNDRETRVAYLEQARQYLVQALEEFPEADHLGTVRENLAVISQDLENLSGELR